MMRKKMRKNRIKHLKLKIEQFNKKKLMLSNKKKKKKKRKKAKEESQGRKPRKSRKPRKEGKIGRAHV